MTTRLHVEASSFSLAAESAHPNKMPFSGVLTHVDQPSASAPHGSGGKRVQLSRNAAERALPTLLGMAVNMAADLSGHATSSVIGVIEAAAINGSAIEIQGYVFARNFPVQAAKIKSDHPQLGFSYEMDVREVENVLADPLVMTDCIFTGAAILRRDKGAYLNTSLAAASAKGTVMDDDTQAAITAAVIAALAPLQAELASLKENPLHLAAANLMGKVEPHAARLEATADGMEGAGIGAAENGGHAKILRNMASDMRASAARGEMPSRFYPSMMAATAAELKPDPALQELKDAVASQGTLIADLKAAAAAQKEAPHRKTQPGAGGTNGKLPDGATPPAVALNILASKGMELPVLEDGSVSAGGLAKAMAAAGIPLAQQTVVKTSLMTTPGITVVA